MLFIIVFSKNIQMHECRTGLCIKVLYLGEFVVLKKFEFSKRVIDGLGHNIGGQTGAII